MQQWRVQPPCHIIRELLPKHPIPGPSCELSIVLTKTAGSEVSLRLSTCAIWSREDECIAPCIERTVTEIF